MSLEIIIGILKSDWPMLLRGMGVTLLIALVGTIVGSILGLAIGIVRTIPLPTNGFKKVFLSVVNCILSAYIEVFRGTPMIVQAMVIYYGSAMAFGIDMNRIFAGLFIVSINTGAYMAEIVRGGIVSIEKGQFEAAEAIGMNHFQTMMNVVLPQVIRNILPATGNEFVINIKDTSVLNVISVTELYFVTKTISSNNYRVFDTFFITCVMYFIMTYTITRILRAIEKKLDGKDSFIMAGNQMQIKIPEIKGNN